MGQRLTGGLVSLVAVGAGNGGAITNARQAWILSPGSPRRAIIRKIMWRNRTVGDGNLLVGYADRTAGVNLFRQVLPSILMLAGFNDELTERQLPICGNTPQGFAIDLTAITGTVGDIWVETDCAVAAAPNDVQVIIEVEEF